MASRERDTGVPSMKFQKFLIVSIVGLIFTSVVNIFAQSPIEDINQASDVCPTKISVQEQETNTMLLAPTAPTLLTRADALYTNNSNDIWITYTATNSGLVSNRVFSIAIDGNGDKWFGTDGGVSKFDGNTWTTYTTSNSGLADNWVSAIAIDENGDKWFGTDGGVSKFDGNTWTTYTTSNSGLGYNWISVVVIDGDGNKWFGTYGVCGGVSKFDGATWTTFTTSNSGLASNCVFSIGIDNNNNHWFGLGGTQSGRVSKFDGATWTTYTTANSGLSNRVTSIAVDGNSGKWFGTYGFGACCDGVHRFDEITWTTYTTANSGLSDNGIRAVTIDGDGNKWFGTNGGVSRFDGTAWTTYTTANSGLTDNIVRAIAVDNNGDKWFGTYDGGVSVLIEPHLKINHSVGKPNSYFTLTGSGYPTNSTATIIINGNTIGTIQTDNKGAFEFELSTDNADEGAYFVTVTVNPSVTVRFTLDSSSANTWPSGGGTSFDVPAGIAFTEFVYLPLIQRH